ncbi:MAG: molecular chaperone, partial [Spirochaetales bacterium]|nr:molecular chaperone [Candidatus Physcosoma equi]
YQLSPLSTTFSPTGPESTKMYTIVNDSSSPIAIQMKTEKRFVDQDGNEYNEPAVGYFQIQPEKMILLPQTSQIIRVQYKGPTTVTKEQSFRIISEQIPYSRGAKYGEDSQNVNFLFVYATSAYVAPSKVLEKVEVSTSKLSDGKLELMIKNTGNVHQVLNSLAITLTAKNCPSYTLTEEELGNAKDNNLLADSSFRLVIDCPKGYEKASSIKAECTYSK